VKILRLTNSDDMNERVPPEQRGAAVTERVVREMLGEEVETVMRVIWPGPALADIVDSWLDRYEPDVVLVRASSYWVTYESMPVRVERRVPLLGPAMAKAVAGAGEHKRFSYGRLGPVVKRAGARLLGGEPHFTPEEAGEYLGQMMRRIAAREGLVAVMRGPAKAFDVRNTARSLKRSEARRDRFERLCEGIAKDVRVPFVSARAIQAGYELLGDGVHLGAAGQETTGRLEGEAIVAAVRAARV
jgi:hypothetical protein